MTDSRGTLRTKFHFANGMIAQLNEGIPDALGVDDDHRIDEFDVERWIGDLSPANAALKSTAFRGRIATFRSQLDPLPEQSGDHDVPRELNSTESLGSMAWVLDTRISELLSSYEAFADELAEESDPPPSDE